MGSGLLEGLSVVIHRNSGVQPTCLYVHVLFKLCVNKEIVFFAAVSMNNTVACYVIPLLLTNYYSGNQIEKNSMGGACSRCDGRGEMRTGFWWET